MTAKDIVAELKNLGSAQTKKTWMTHGPQEPCLGVKGEDIHRIGVAIKELRQLRVELCHALGVTRLAVQVEAFLVVGIVNLR